MEKELIVPSWVPKPGVVSVLVDYHHQSLLQSFYLLFQKWGWNMYIPLGREWYEEGFWELYHKDALNDGVISQYLDKTHRWGLLGQEESKAREHLGYPPTDAKGNFPNILDLTFEECKKISLDIIIATTPENYRVFKRLRDEHQPHAKLILETEDVIFLKMSRKSNKLNCLNTHFLSSIC